MQAATGVLRLVVLTDEHDRCEEDEEQGGRLPGDGIEPGSEQKRCQQRDHRKAVRLWRCRNLGDGVFLFGKPRCQPGRANERVRKGLRSLDRRKADVLDADDGITERDPVVVAHLRAAHCHTSEQQAVGRVVVDDLDVGADVDLRVALGHERVGQLHIHVGSATDVVAACSQREALPDVRTFHDPQDCDRRSCRCCRGDRGGKRDGCA